MPRSWGCSSPLAVESRTGRSCLVTPCGVSPLHTWFQLWIQWGGLLRRSTGETDPAVECGGTTFTAATGLDAEGIRGALDDVAEADRLVGNEARQPYLIPWALALLRRVVLRFFLRHTLYLPTNVCIM